MSTPFQDVGIPVKSRKEEPGFQEINLLLVLKVDDQVVYAMVPRPLFSKLVLFRIKIMTDGRNVDVIPGNFS